MDKLIIKRDYFDDAKMDYLKIAGVKEAEFLKEVGFAIQILHGNKQLMKSTKTSLLKCILNVAQTGLTLNPTTKFAYLVPRWNRETGAVEACLEASYMGLTNLLIKSGAVKNINSQLVYDGDEIEIDLASDRIVIKHIPYILTGNEKGAIKAVYSLAVLHDGSHHCELMSYGDVMDIRETSESYKAVKAGKLKSCIWLDYEGEMVRKTVIKRHYKYLPKSAELERFNQAVKILDEDYRQKVDYNFTEYMESLVLNSTLEEHYRQDALSEIYAADYKDQLKKLETDLREAQLNPVTENSRYNQTDVRNHVKKLMDNE